MFPEWRKALENLPDDVRENAIVLMENFPLLAALLKGSKISINISFNIDQTGLITEGEDVQIND